ncbi:MAG: putative secreted protein [Candidatus Phytoplasma cynodontis]|nr:MAG: putative secreted protein [Candidatus Phytoplasma cynodontis]
MNFLNKNFNLFFKKISFISFLFFLISIILRYNSVFALELKNDFEPKIECFEILSNDNNDNEDIYVEFRKSVLNTVDKERNYFIENFFITWIKNESTTLEDIRKNADTNLKGILQSNDLRRNALAQNFLHTHF